MARHEFYCFRAMSAMHLNKPVGRNIANNIVARKRVAAFADRKIGIVEVWNSGQHS